MPPRPKRKQRCPACKQQMSWFGDHWVCVNFKVHMKAVQRGDAYPKTDDKKRGKLWLVSMTRSGSR